jgi:hypothetical protein
MSFPRAETKASYCPLSADAGARLLSVNQCFLPMHEKQLPGNWLCAYPVLTAHQYSSSIKPQPPEGIMAFPYLAT